MDDHAKIKVDESSSSDALSRWQTNVILLLIIVVGVSLHWPLLEGTFIGVDDSRQITNNYVVSNPSWRNFKRVAFTNFLNNNHNPMYTSFLLNWAVTPGSCKGFAVFNLIWYALTIFVFFRFSRHFLRERHWQLLATALFSVHSVNIDIYAWISARCHMMGITFLLLTFIAWRNYLDKTGRHNRIAWYIVAVMCAWFAIWNKNIFFVVGPLLLVFDFYRSRRLSILLFLDKLPMLVLGMIPVYILKDSTHYLGVLDKPAMGGSLYATILNDFGLLVQYLLHLVKPAITYIWVDVYPVFGPFEVSTNAGLVAMRLPPVLNMSILAILGLSVIWLKIKHRVKTPLYFCLFSGLVLATVMNIPPRWVEFAFRYDLIPSVFFCLAFVSVFGFLWQKLGWIGKGSISVLVAVLLVWHSVVTYKQTLAWDTTETVARNCADNFNDALICRETINHITEIERDYAEARLLEADRVHTERSSIRPTKPAYYLAVMYERRGDLEKALFYYERSLLRDSIASARKKSLRKKVTNLKKRLKK